MIGSTIIGKLPYPNLRALTDYTPAKRNAADLAARFCIDIRSWAFWDGALDVIRQRIDRYCTL